MEDFFTDVAHNTLELTGEYDLARAASLRDVLRPLVDEGLPVVLDLSRATFIDSVTLGLIVRAARELSRNGSELRIFMPGTTERQVRELFRITGLDRVLAIDTRRPAGVGSTGDSGRRDQSAS